MPRATSRISATSQGLSSATGGNAGAISTAKLSANVMRAGAGIAFSPNAGTNVTAGAARANPRPIRPRSSPAESASD